MRGRVFEQEPKRLAERERQTDRDKRTPCPSMLHESTAPHEWPRSQWCKHDFMANLSTEIQATVCVCVCVTVHCVSHGCVHESVCVCTVGGTWGRLVFVYCCKPLTENMKKKQQNKSCLANESGSPQRRGEERRQQRETNCLGVAQIKPEQNTKNKKQNQMQYVERLGS